MSMKKTTSRTARKGTARTTSSRRATTKTATTTAPSVQTAQAKAIGKHKAAAPAHFTIPKIEGQRVALSKTINDPDLSYAMHLVVRILQPASLNDAAAALIDLLRQASGEDDASERNAVTFFATFQALMLRDDWIESFKKLRAMQQRRQVKSGRRARK